MGGREGLIDTAVKTAFDAGKGRSGSPRLVLDLAEAGHPHDRKTIADSMRRQGLRQPVLLWSLPEAAQKA